jgi:tetratricopeptide (TPR) repeat protein
MDYNLENIRELLAKGFEEQQLRSLGLYVPEFEPIRESLAKSASKSDIIDQILDYADRNLVVNALLEWAKRRNPARYEKHKPYATEVSSSAPQPAIPASASTEVKVAEPQPSLGQVWNVPHQRNLNFTGREELLRDLRASLTSGQPAALTQAIKGLGGVGKTQLAVEYAYRHAAEYQVVWWMRSEEAATLAADYTALAPALGLPGETIADQNIVREVVRRWLEQHQDWLLIFDNAEEPALLRPYLPQRAKGHILITSRNQSWGSLASPLSVHVFEPAEACQFLMERTGQADEAAAAALAEALGHLPLALEQARAYIEETGRSLAAYLDLFRTHRQALLSYHDPAADYPDTVATTWNLALERVQQSAPAGTDLLRLCAFLAPDDIPTSLLIAGANHLPSDLAAVVADPWPFDQAIAALRRYSLVEFDGVSLSVHRLVQAVTRGRLTAEARLTWAGIAVRLLAEVFPFDENDLATWVESARLLPHILAIAERAETSQVATETTAHTLRQAGRYLYERAEFAQARMLLERSLAIHQAILGDNHPNVATTFNLLARVFLTQGDYAAGRSHLEKALSIWQAVFGDDHPDTAQGLNDWGYLLRAQGDLAGARPYYERALAIREKVLGENHPDTANSLNNMGSLLRDQGDLAGARPYHERALAIREKVLGENHHDTANSLNNMGSLLQEQGDSAGARSYFERALAIQEKVLGENHPDTATSLNNIGYLLLAQGNLAGARSYFERALAIQEKVLGESHPDTARSLNNLGQLLYRQRDYPGARRCLERAWAICQARLGPKHPLTRQVGLHLKLIPKVGHGSKSGQGSLKRKQQKRAKAAQAKGKRKR